MGLAVSWKMAATALAFGFVAAMLLGMVCTGLSSFRMTNLKSCGPPQLFSFHGPRRRHSARVDEAGATEAVLPLTGMAAISAERDWNQPFCGNMRSRKNCVT